VPFNQARCLSIENQKRTLRLDRSGNMLTTWVTGKEVWKKE
jgi:N-acetylglucosamine-6-phosphate deacetylase